MQVEGYTINKEDIFNLKFEAMDIPYGNDFQVATTQIDVIHIDTRYENFIIYNKAESGQLVDNMVMCALQGKQFFSMGQAIQGGLAIFQRYYDEHYVTAKWIGVNEDIIDFCERLTK